MSENGRVPLQQYIEARIDDTIRLMDERFAGSDRHWDRVMADSDRRSEQRDQSIRDTAHAALVAANNKHRDAISIAAVIVSLTALILTLIFHFTK